MTSLAVKLFGVVAAVGALGFLVAHGDSSDSTPQQKSVVQKIVTADTASAKPGAPVAMDYTLHGTPAVGEPMDVSLKFSSDHSAPMTIEGNLHTDDGLDLSGQDGDKFSVRLDAKTPSYIHSITVLPKQQGLFYVHVVTTADRQSRSFAVPLEVGQFDRDEAMKPDGSLSTDSNGELILSTPAK